MCATTTIIPFSSFYPLALDAIVSRLAINRQTNALLRRLSFALTWNFVRMAGFAFEIIFSLLINTMS